MISENCGTIFMTLNSTRGYPKIQRSNSYIFFLYPIVQFSSFKKEDFGTVINYRNSLWAGQVPNYEFIKVETAGEKKNVGLITLNRPKALNALCDKLMTEVNDAVVRFDRNESVAAVVITGSEKAFAAGKAPFESYLRGEAYLEIFDKSIYQFLYFLEVQENFENIP